MHKGSLNPRVAFIGDMRENGNPKLRDSERRARLGKRAKDVGVYDAWAAAFPGEEFPNFCGSAFYAYTRLEEAGWRWSSRYGWRCVSRLTPVAAEDACTSNSDGDSDDRVPAEHDG